MSANEFGRETHWQIVCTDAAQPWHARLVSNYRTIMTSEKYARRASALRAIELAAPEWLASKTPLEVDERTPPPTPPTIEPPFYVTTDMRGGSFWHDRDYHYRNCYGDECTEGAPPAGTLIAGRFGKVAAPASDLPPLDWNVE